MNTCPNCGTEIPDSSNGCPACGYGALPKLKLVGENGELSTAIDLSFGKQFAAKICGESSRFMNDIQFWLKFKDDKWYIKPHPRTANVTFLDGVQLMNETELNDSAKISLKNNVAEMTVRYI